MLGVRQEQEIEDHFWCFQDVLIHHIRVIFCGFSCWIFLKKKFSNAKSTEKKDSEIFESW